MSKLTRVLVAVALMATAVPALLAGRAVAPVHAATTLVFADSFDGPADPGWNVTTRDRGTVQWQTQMSMAGGALRAQSTTRSRSLAFAERSLPGRPAEIALGLDVRTGSQSSATAKLPLITLTGANGRLFQLLRAQNGDLVLLRPGRSVRLAGKLALGTWRHLAIEARGGADPRLRILLAGKPIYDNSSAGFLTGASFQTIRLGSDRDGRGGASFFDGLIVNAVTTAPPSPTPSPSPTATASATPTASPTSTLGPTPSPSSPPVPQVCPGAPSPSPTPTSPPTASPVPTATPSPTPTPAPLFYFWGRGTDHGVGMSQWGARGRAQAGQTFDQILHHYYTNVVIATIDGGSPIRVRIGTSFTPTPGCPARLTSVVGDWTSPAFGTRVFAVGSYLEMWPDAIAPAPPAPPAGPATAVGWTAVVYSAEGVELARTPTLDVSMKSVAGADGAIKVSFKDNHPKMNVFRDSVRLLVNSQGSLDQINTLPLDYYLLGVVPSEMPGSWSLEAVKAQAVAARSYAWPRLNGSGYYDIGASSASQNYKGVLHEYPNSNRAVLDTAGQVLTYNGRVVAAYYHSSGGGHTENSEYAFYSPIGNPGTVVGYCRGKPDVDASGRAYDRNSPDYYWQSVSFTMDQLSAIYALDSRTNVGQITNLTFNRGVSGRAYQVVMTGTLGTKTVSGGTFSGVFNKNRPGGANLVSNMFYLTPVGERPGG